MQFKVRWLKLTLCLALVACSSTQKNDKYLMPDFDDKSHAEGSAFTAESMHFNIPMTARPATYKPEAFYFKHCSEIGEQVFYSKTSYDCSGP